MSEDQSGSDDELSSRERKAAGLAGELNRRLNDLVLHACAMLPAIACNLKWHLGPDAGSSVASTAPERSSAERMAVALDSLDAINSRAFSSSDAELVSERILDPAGMAEIGAAAAIRIFGGVFSEGEAAVRIAVAPAPEASESETRALLEIIGRAALSELAAAHLGASRDFWRSRAMRQSAKDVSRLREADLCRELVAQASRVAGAKRLRAIGHGISSAVSCPKWFIAVNEGDSLRIEAASPPQYLRGAEQCSPRLREAVRAGCVIEHKGEQPANDTSVENRILGKTWTAVPFDGGVIALGGLFAPKDRAVAEAMVSAAAPLIRVWIAERRLGEYRTLVQRMALRMFAAIDDERARIARDLHDDQGQLLAAARLALQGKPETARIIFEKLDRELRTRTRQLRPANLGKLTLGAALKSELARLGLGGIETHLSISQGVENASMPVQQLCFQVAREALTNVIRHAGANSVTINVERVGAAVWMSIADNGRGIKRAPGPHSSSGLTGIRERLELMGGSLRVDSDHSGTRLVAEIPEPL